MKKLMLFLGGLVFAVLLASCGKNPVLSVMPAAAVDSVQAGTTTLQMVVTSSGTSTSTPCITIKSYQRPFFTWSYKGVKDDHVLVSVSKVGSGYWWYSCLGNSATTNTTYGYELPGAMRVGWEVSPKTLTVGTYNVAVILGSEHGYTGYGYGKFVIE